MKRKDDKLARAAHIKARTEGTSNEISFSVLDAAKYAMDNDRRRFSAVDFLPRRKRTDDDAVDVSRETSTASTREHSYVAAKEQPQRKCSHPRLPGKDGRQSAHSSAETNRCAALPKQSSSAKRLSIEEEIARRKARRRRGRILAATTVAVVSLCIVAVGLWAWHTETTEQQGYESELMQSLQLISQADETILQLDEVVDEPFSDESRQKADAVSEEAQQTVKLLSDADGKARNASELLKDPVVKDVANQAVASVAARQAMLQNGMQLVKASGDAAEAAQTCEAAWSKVLEADDKTHEASKLVENDDPATSKEKTLEAKSLFEEAEGEIKTLQAAHSDVDLSAFVSYIDKRLEAAGYAVATDDALTDRNKEEAVAQNDSYNKAESEAAALAAKLPSDVAQLFHDAYSKQWADTIKMYASKRAEAGTSDAVIRDYLGAQGK